MVPANVSSGGSGAPTNAKYVTAQAESSLSAEVNLGALTTGILKHSVSGSVSTPATAGAGDVDTILPTQSGHSGEFLTTDGSNSSWAAAGGGSGPSIIDFDSTETGNTAATETTLFTTTVAGGTLANNGETIEFVACGKYTSSFDSDAAIRVYFGATKILDTVGMSITAADGRWRLKGEIIRVDATTQKCTILLSWGQEPGGFGWSDIQYTGTNYCTAGETLSGSSILKITGDGTTANDIYGEFWKVVKWPAS